MMTLPDTRNTLLNNTLEMAGPVTFLISILAFGRYIRNCLSFVLFDPSKGRHLFSPFVAALAHNLRP